MSSHAIFTIQANLCRAMSDPIRLEILHILRQGPQCVLDIAQMVGQPQPTVSRHLAVLRNNGVVKAQRQGQNTFYQVANPKLLSICDLMREVLQEQVTHQAELFNPGV